MRHHGLLFGCMQATPGFFHQDQEFCNIKRAAGAHKIASYMRSEGWDIEVVDYWLSFDDEEFLELIHSRITKETVFIGISSTFPIVGNMLTRANRFIRLIKKYYPDVAIIAGSKQFYVTQNMNADYHLAGYGEFGLLELCKKLLGKENTLVVESDMRGGKYVNCDANHPCYPQKNLVVEYEKRDFILPYEQMTLEFARGCKFKCKFCSYNVIGLKGEYYRDMPSLYDELKRNNDLWGLTDYYVADETVNDSIPKLKALAEQIQRLPFLPNLTGYIRADLITSREDDRKYLSDMNFWGHYYGIESLNHASAKSIGKGMHPDKIKQGLLDVRDYFKSRGDGFYRGTYSMIIGLPHETEQTLLENFGWLTDNFPDESLIAFPLYLQNQQFNKTNSSEFDLTWSTSGDFWPEEGTIESFGASPDQLPEFSRQYVWNQFSQDTSIKWQHDTMNWWEANKLFANLIRSPHLLGKGILNWGLGNFTSTGHWSMEEALKIKNNDPIAELMTEKTNAHIEDYKWKKLSL